jgi:hypothetical protein
MVRLIQRFPSKAPQLASDIADKAEGVFFWVKLVVQLLIEGLEDGDDLDELQAKLYSLPSGLSDLYRRMFGKMIKTIKDRRRKFSSLCTGGTYSYIINLFLLLSCLTLFALPRMHLVSRSPLLHTRCLTGCWVVLINESRVDAVGYSRFITI